jgi:hypothetical protein
MQFAQELRLTILQIIQILHHTCTFPLHIGSSAFYISYTCAHYHKMLLRILQNVTGDFSHRVDMSNFKEKYFLREVMITQLAKIFTIFHESWIFIAILTRNFQDPHPDRVKYRPRCTCFHHQSSYYTLAHTSPSVGACGHVVEMRFSVILRCMLSWRIVHYSFYLTVNTTVKNLLKATNLIQFIAINLRIQNNKKLQC